MSFEDFWNRMYYSLYVIFVRPVNKAIFWLDVKLDWLLGKIPFMRDRMHYSALFREQFLNLDRFSDSDQRFIGLIINLTVISIIGSLIYLFQKIFGFDWTEDGVVMLAFLLGSGYWLYCDFRYLPENKFQRYFKKFQKKDTPLRRRLWCLFTLLLIVGSGAVFFSSMKGLENNRITYKYYYYSYSSYSFCDEIIELKYKGSRLVSGHFWGNSDDFMWGREGCLPGFATLPMQSLWIEGDSIFFGLDASEETFFSAPVQFPLYTSDEALNAGYYHWGAAYSDMERWKEQGQWSDVVLFRGEIRNDTLCFERNGQVRYRTLHRFVPMSFDSIRHKKAISSFEK